MFQMFKFHHSIPGNVFSRPTLSTQLRLEGRRISRAWRTTPSLTAGVPSRSVAHLHRISSDFVDVARINIYYSQMNCFVMNIYRNQMNCFVFLLIFVPNRFFIATQDYGCELTRRSVDKFHKILTWIWNTLKHKQMPLIKILNVTFINEIIFFWFISTLVKWKN